MTALKILFISLHNIIMVTKMNLSQFLSILKIMRRNEI